MSACDHGEAIVFTASCPCCDHGARNTDAQMARLEVVDHYVREHTSAGEVCGNV